MNKTSTLIFNKYFLAISALVVVITAFTVATFDSAHDAFATGSSCECDGKVTKLTLKYLGSSSALIEVVQKDSSKVFSGTVSPSGSFTFEGTDKGTLGTEISIFVNGVLNQKIHTSCSQPIEIGMTFGDFKILDGYSKNNGQLCGDDDPPPPITCIDATPKNLEFYLPFKPSTSGDYPAQGTTPDSVTLTSSNPTSNGYLNVDLLFEDVPLDFTNVTLYVEFDDLDLQGDTISSYTKRGTLFETFTLKDASSNVIDTLDSSDPQDDNFLWSRSLSDSLFGASDVTLKTSLTAELKLTSGSSLSVGNSKEGYKNVKICGEIAPVCRPVIVDYAGLRKGELVNNQYSSYGISITGDGNSRPDQVIVFDTNASGTPDSDLEVDIGNVGILPENLTDTSPADGYVDNPNDSSRGGKQIFTFDYPRVVNSFVFVDQDSETGSATAYDSDNNPIGNVSIPSAGDGSVQTINMNMDGVSRLEIVYSGSGAVSSIDLGCPGDLPESDLAIDITDIPPSTTSIVGSNVEYRITVTNNGPDDATNALVTVDAPGILTNTSWTCTASAGSSCSTSQTGDINDIVNIKNGGTLVYTFLATIDPATTATTLTVPAEVAIAGDTNLSNNTDSDTNKLKKDYDIIVDKTSTNSEFIPGTPITYVMTIRNNGPSDVTGGTVTDTFPSKLSGAVWTCVATPSSATTNCSPSGSGDINDSVDVAVGGKLVYTVNALIKPDATGTLLNKVIFDSNDGVVKEDDHEEELKPKADLAASITNGLTELTPGQNVTYTMVVSNNGPSDVVGAIVSNNIPGVLNGATWSCVSSSPGSSCGDPSGMGSINSTADLPVGGSVTYTLTATIDSGAAGILANTIVVVPPFGTIDPFLPNNSATDIDPLKAVTDLLVTKTDGKTVAVPGTLNTYTIKVKNVGPSDVAGEFSDPIPAELVDATWTCTASSVNSSCTASGTGDIVDNAVFLKPGEYVTYTLTATIDPAAVGDIVNTATITIPGTVPLQQFSDTDTTTLVPEADLAIEITDIPASTLSVVGTNILYQITVTNNGPSDAVGANVTVDAPVDLINLSWTCLPSIGSSCTASQTGDINDTVNIKKDGILVYALSAKIDPATTATTLTVPAQVAFVGDTNLANNTDSDTNALKKEYEILVNKDSLNTEFIPGTPITYVLTITNAGPSKLIGGTVTDNFPTKLNNATWSCIATPLADSACSSTGIGNINDTVDIAVGGKVEYTVTADIKPDATGELLNIVKFDSNDGIVKEDDHKTDLTPKADLGVTKTNGVIELTAGAPVTYTMVVTNSGPSNVIGATITDNIPGTLTGATWSCSALAGSACGTSSGTGSINTTANLPVGGSVTFVLSAIVDSGAAGSLTNTISVAVPVGIVDPNNANNTATDTDPLNTVTEISVTKTDGKTVAVPGTINTYTIVVSNVGPSDLSGEFSDPIPAKLLNATWTCSPSSVDSSCTASGTGDIVDNAVFLKAGGSVTYTLTALIDPTAEGDVVNTATITIPGTVPLLTYSDTDTTALLPEADLAIVIVTKDKGTQVPGGPITYTVTAVNNGPSAVNQALIKDTMPPELVVGSIDWVCAPSVGSTCTAVGTGDISDLVYLPVGGSVVYTVTGTINITSTGLIENIVTIDPPVSVIETDYSNNTSSTVDSGIINADVAISITDSPDPLEVGSTITYTTQVVNIGPLTANGTIATITLPSGTTFSSVSTTLGTCTGGASVVCDLGDFAKDVPVTITITAVANVAGVLTANASVTSTTTDVNTANNTSTTNTTVTSGGGGCTVNCGGGGGDKPTPKPKPEPEPEPEEYCLSYTDTRDLRFTDMGGFAQVFQTIANVLKGTFMTEKGYKDLDQYVVSGYDSFTNDTGEREVRLGLNVNRLQWAKLLMTSHCLRIFEATKLPPVTFFGNDLLEFADIPLAVYEDQNADWYADVMYSAKYYEIIDGTYESTADTLREVTFAEAIKMLIRAGEAAGVTPFDLFSRLTENNPWYLIYYSRAVSEGIMVKPFGIDLNLEANVKLPREYSFALLLKAILVRGLYGSTDTGIIENLF